MPRNSNTVKNGEEKSKKIEEKSKKIEEKGKASKSSRITDKNISQTDVCGNCDKYVKDFEMNLCCDNCGSYYHGECLKINSKMYKTLMKKPFWTCSKKCNEEYQHNNEDVEIFDLENPTLKDVMSKLFEISESQKYMSTIYEENKALIEDYSNLRTHFFAMKNELNNVKFELNALQQEKLDNNIIIYGVPNIPNENGQKLKEDVSEIMKSINVDVNENDISDIYRLRNNKNVKNLPVIVKFTKKEMKMNILEKKKGIVIKPKDQGGSIKINEHLTTVGYKLLLKTREVLGKHFKFIWSKDGKIFIKKDDTSSSNRIHLRSFEEIDQYNLDN